MKLAVNQATLMKTPMEIFLKSISRAGFQGVELRRDESFEYLKHHSVEALDNLLKENHLKCITFNAIELFSLCPEREFQRMVDYTEKLMIIGNQIGCDTIIAVPSFLQDGFNTDNEIISQTINRLKILAKLAEQYRFKLGFEPLGFSNCSVRKVDMALEIINNEELPEMGLIIDTFHFFVGEHSIHDLDKIPLDKLWLIHLNDAIEKPFQELQDSHRILPCRGFFGLREFMDKLKEIGYEKWLSLELFNEEIWNKDPLEVAKDAMSSIKKLV